MSMDFINAVNAQYEYASEFLAIYAQIGAILKLCS